MLPRILIVEDDPDLQQVFAMGLMAAGFEVKTAQTGAEALLMVRDFQPHLVTVDIELPDIDGMELVRAIRRHDFVKQHRRSAHLTPQIKLVIITGNSQVAHNPETLQLADLCLLKPTSLGQLVRLSEKLLAL